MECMAWKSEYIHLEIFWDAISSGEKTLAKLETDKGYWREDIELNQIVLQKVS